MSIAAAPLPKLGASPTLETLLRLLSRHSLEGEPLARAAAHVALAADDDELEGLDGAGEFIAYALANVLAQFIASSNRLAGLHAELSDLVFPPLPAPELPEAMGYFEWLDQQLARREAAQGGCEAVALELGVDDRLRLLVVRRVDTARILRLARFLGLRIAPATPAPAQARRRA